MFNLPNLSAKESFKLASAEAALFELYLRMQAGTIDTLASLKIDTKVSAFLDRLLEHYATQLSTEDSSLIKLACTLRNKLFHCEFSTTRSKLNELNSRARGGDVKRVRIDPANFNLAVLSAKIAGVQAGDTSHYEVVGDTKTRTMKDIFGWLIECELAGEFAEARDIFCRANAVLERIARGQDE